MATLLGRALDSMKSDGLEVGVMFLASSRGKHDLLRRLLWSQG